MWIIFIESNVNVLVVLKNMLEEAWIRIDYDETVGRVKNESCTRNEWNLNAQCGRFERVEKKKDKLLNGRAVVTRGCHENYIGDDRKQIAKFFYVFSSCLVLLLVMSKKKPLHSWNSLKGEQFSLNSSSSVSNLAMIKDEVCLLWVKVHSHRKHPQVSDMTRVKNRICLVWISWNVRFSRHE